VKGIASRSWLSFYLAMLYEDAEVPEGVELSDPEDYAYQRNAIYGVKDTLESVFPKSYGGVTVSLSDTHWGDPDNADWKQIRDASLKNGSLYRRLRGTLTMTEDATGKKLDEKKMTLMKVPILTDLGVYIDNGTHYSLAAQDRIIPAPYTRRKLNGNVETAFSTRTGTGIGNLFRVSMDPESGVFKLEKQGKTAKLYPALKAMGVSDEELARRWGPEVLKANKDKYDEKAVAKAIAMFVRKPDPAWTPEQGVEKLKEALEGLQIHKGVASTTLPGMFDSAKRATFKRASSGEDMLVKALRATAMKLAAGRYGACCIYWLGRGYYLLEENTYGPDKGKLRPAGGGKEPGDKNLRETILREIKEEFNIDPEYIKPYLRFLGLQKDGEYKDSAVFLCFRHGLVPGIYQASNDKSEKIKLVKAKLSDPRYIGPNPKTDLYIPEEPEEEDDETVDQQ
jgi:DNA-directed RNA polymerase beta subunit